MDAPLFLWRCPLEGEEVGASLPPWLSSAVVALEAPLLLPRLIKCPRRRHFSSPPPRLLQCFQEFLAPHPRHPYLPKRPCFFFGAYDPKKKMFLRSCRPLGPLGPCGFCRPPWFPWPPRVRWASWAPQGGEVLFPPHNFLSPPKKNCPRPSRPRNYSFPTPCGPTLVKTPRGT